MATERISLERFTPFDLCHAYGECSIMFPLTLYCMTVITQLLARFYAEVKWGTLLAQALWYQ